MINVHVQPFKKGCGTGEVVGDVFKIFRCRVDA